MTIGIDVSKGKSMMAAITDTKEIVLAPKEYLHTKDGLAHLVAEISALKSTVKIVMESTGHYHEPVAYALKAAGFYVSVLNPILMYGYGSNSIRGIKTDKKDSLKLARYALDNINELREYESQETIRSQLKMFSRQYNISIKTMHALQNHLISILDKTLPDVNKLFSCVRRKDGHQKWLDFAASFVHAEEITDKSQFTKEYKIWCAQKKYRFTLKKAHEIYAKYQDVVTTMPNNQNTRLLIQTSASQIQGINITLTTVKAEMTRLAQLLPEYQAVLSFFGVGELTAAQLIAEIGDVRRFHSRGALIAFAGTDPTPKQSGTYNKKSTNISKRGSAPLRKTLFQIICTYLRHSPQNEPVYIFLDKKREEGKPYFVYMTAAANKFLKIYYAKITKLMQELE
ncbi:MAG: IS110 family transposase [Defluviitaleaceae bacterium]|nr:IS110 family transposase [Defluviitaleaceae bacterium]